jgi:hypothetical protein
MERESIVRIVSLQESKFSLYKYVKNGKGVCLYYISTSDTLYRSGYVVAGVKAPVGGRLEAVI